MSTDIAETRPDHFQCASLTRYDAPSNVGGSNEAARVHLAHWRYCRLATCGERALSAEERMADSRRVRQLGDIRVTALDDGYGDVPIAVVVNIDEAGGAR